VFTISLPNTNPLPRLHRGGLGHPRQTLDMSWYHRTLIAPFLMSRTYPDPSTRLCVIYVLPAPTVFCRPRPGVAPLCTRCGERKPLRLRRLYSVFLRKYLRLKHLTCLW
jgi:hypothetical protein